MEIILAILGYIGLGMVMAFIAAMSEECTIDESVALGACWPLAILLLLSDCAARFGKWTRRVSQVKIKRKK